MISTLYDILIGSLLILAIAFVWVVIVAMVSVSVDRTRKRFAKVTVFNRGSTPATIEIRNVANGVTHRIELQPEYSKTLDMTKAA